MDHKKILPLSLGALGIVYGDIGTSPLYAFRESLRGLMLTPENIYGVLSLIFWSLILIISIKYLLFVLRADNDGEGGILALYSLLKKTDPRISGLLFIVAIAGTVLLVGDGMLTPAISVMSAVEGLAIITPHLHFVALPLTFMILFLLFFCQRYGTAKIAVFFGPILLIWFITIGVLGIIQIQKNPMIIEALNPYYAVMYFVHSGWKGFAMLGGIFLVVTGGEALYADLGHFGKLPIRLSWFLIVLPCLLLNYFGQGAHLLNHPEAINNPFYALAPEWFSYPLLIIATLASMVASQAVISGSFSLARQAVLLELYPKIRIVQTSQDEKGQIYIPQINTILAIGTLALVLTFKNSSALANAYGIAVNLDMLITTILIIWLARISWQWSLFKIIIFAVVFLSIDITFLTANAHKFLSGGWLPILFAILGATVMFTFYQGILFMRSFHYGQRENLSSTIAQIKPDEINFLTNSTAIFITDPYDQSGGTLLQYLKLHKIMPEHALIVCLNVINDPYVNEERRFNLIAINQYIHHLTINHGFMETINVPTALSQMNELKLLSFEIDLKKVIFLIEINHISATRREASLRFFWQEKLFAFMMRNSSLDIEFYHLPYDRTIGIGSYCEI